MTQLRSLALGLAVLVASALPVAAQNATVEPIPVPEGGSVEAEISFTNQDLLPLVKRFVETAASMKLPPGVPPEMQAMLSHLNLQDLADAIKGVEAIQFVTYTLPGEHAQNAKAVADFYAQSMPTGLRRVALVNPDPNTNVQVYAGPNLALFGMLVTRERDRDRVAVGELRGSVDLDKLMGFVSRAGEAAVMFLGVRHASRSQPAPVTMKAAPPRPKTPPPPAPPKKPLKKGS